MMAKQNKSKSILIFLVVFFVATPIGAFAASVNLRWNANTEADISSYNIYFGTSPRNYGSPIPAGKVTSYEINGLDQGRKYYFALTAIDTSGNESGFSSEVSANATSPQPDAVNLTASRNSPQNEGAVVQFTASASGGSGNYEYRFWVQGPYTNGKWIVAQDFSTASTFNWNTSGKAGANSIVVWSRNVGTSPQTSAIPTAGRYFVVNKIQTAQAPQPESVRLSTSMSSPQKEGATVRFNANASGGSGKYEYRFWVQGPHTNGKWIVAQDFSTARTFDWNTSGKAGVNSIVVWCRNVGTSPESSAIPSAGRYFAVNSTQTPQTPQPESVSLSTSLPSPQQEGATVRFIASASGGSGSYEYRFWVAGPHTNGKWVVAQDFSTNSTFNWDTSGKAGVNSIVVWCRIAGTSPASSSISTAGKYYDVN